MSFLWVFLIRKNHFHENRCETEQKEFTELPAALRWFVFYDMNCFLVAELRREEKILLNGRNKSIPCCLLAIFSFHSVCCLVSFSGLEGITKCSPFLSQCTIPVSNKQAVKVEANDPFVYGFLWS